MRARTTEIRCSAPHPEVPGWVCRAKLSVFLTPGYELLEGDAPPQCVPVICWRCGAEYAVCPVQVA